MFKKLYISILFAVILLCPQGSQADDYPNQPLEIIVPFGKGGSTDRMTRIMTKLLKEELTQPVGIKNIPGEGTLLGTSYFLNQIQDGYFLFSSTFSPYLTNTILSGKSSYTINDFEILNMQWFDYDFIAVHKDSSFNTLADLLNHLKKNSSTLTVALMYRSSGHLLFKLLLKELSIQKSHVKIKFYNGGKEARAALINKKVDFIVISAQGSKYVREFMKPLAVSKSTRAKRWDAPTLNEALSSQHVTLPIITGSMRGFGVSRKFKTDYPGRYKILTDIFKKILAKKRAQNILKNNGIGYIWLAPKKSNELLNNSFTLFKKYNYLLND
jgi:tripartite-type tricarboxylate transporter receptor subunit TctC